MPDFLELRWEYTPATIFEERLVADFDGCHIMVDDGTVLATLPIDSDETQSPLRRHVEAYVDSLLLGVQIATHTECLLSKPSLNTLHGDGRRGYVIECESAVARFTGGHVDLIYTGSDGTVVDTRRNRILRKHNWSLAAAAFGPTDDVLARMLRSYRSAIADPEDELIHLYEVRDSLSSTFGSKTNALRKLQIAEPAWNRLGQLCNVLPLRQGRHRGSVGEPIRDASLAELAEARHLTSSFITAYIRYLERTWQRPPLI